MDEFAREVTKVPSDEVQVDIKCEAELVEHSFQAKVTKTEEDTEQIRVMHYGDLSEDDRKSRPFYERIFGVDKHRTVRKHTEAFPIPHGVGGEEKRNTPLMIGTNVHGAYALQGNTESSTQCIEGFHQVMGQFERNCLVRSLKHDLKYVKIRKDAKRKWEQILSLMSNDPALGETLTPFLNAFKRKVDKLPDMVDDYKGSSVLEVRPGEELPVVRCMATRVRIQVYDNTQDMKDFGLEPVPAPAGQKFESYSLWFCNPDRKTNHWSKTDVDGINCREGEVPYVAFNDTHLVVVCHVPLVEGDEEEKDDTLCAKIYHLSPSGKPGPRPFRTLYFTFPAEHYTPTGVYHVHLSREGILSVGSSCGAIVIDVLGNISWARLIMLKTKDDEAYGRLVTSVQVFHPQARPAKMWEEDVWDDTYIRQDGTFHEDLADETKSEETQVPAWSGTLVMGTSVGECFGLSWRNGTIQFVELTPACEPILSCLYSNQRVVMHCISSISAKLMPYFHDGITQMEMSRPRAVALLGTQLYILDKYGNIQIMSTLARNIVQPFKPPSSRPLKGEKDDAEEPEAPKEIDLGLTNPCQAAYPGLHVTQTQIRSLYPNGVLDTIEIDKRAQFVIEQKSHVDKAKEEKKAKKKEEKKQKQKQRNKKNVTGQRKKHGKK